MEGAVRRHAPPKTVTANAYPRSAEQLDALRLKQSACDRRRGERSAASDEPHANIDARFRSPMAPWYFEGVLAPSEGDSTHLRGAPIAECSARS